MSTCLQKAQSYSQENTDRQGEKLTEKKRKRRVVGFYHQFNHSYCYRQQTKFVKVMFSQVFVCPRGISVPPYGTERAIHILLGYILFPCKFNTFSGVAKKLNDSQFKMMISQWKLFSVNAKGSITDTYPLSNVTLSPTTRIVMRWKKFSLAFTFTWRE